jgi:hypothetical protein
MTLTIDLREEELDLLNVRARAQGLSAEQCAQQLLRQALSEAARKSLPEKIREIWADLPDDARAKLPKDGASQHDHYLYGLPKRDL